MIEPIIITGVLDTVSRGTQKAEGLDWKYEYIRIGDRRLDKVSVASYIDVDLNNCIGEEITISILPSGNKNFTGTILAFRRGEKIERAPLKTIGQEIADRLQFTFWCGMAGIFVFIPIFAVVALIFYIFNDRVEDAAGTWSCFAAFIWVVWAAFFSKGSTLSSARVYNAARNALG